MAMRAEEQINSSDVNRIEQLTVSRKSCAAQQTQGLPAYTHHLEHVENGMETCLVT
jgi:hypothetical protein